MNAWTWQRLASHIPDFSGYMQIMSVTWSEVCLCFSLFIRREFVWLDWKVIPRILICMEGTMVWPSMCMMTVGDLYRSFLSKQGEIWFLWSTFEATGLRVMIYHIGCSSQVWCSLLNFSPCLTSIGNGTAVTCGSTPMLQAAELLECNVHCSFHWPPSEWIVSGFFGRICLEIMQRQPPCWDWTRRRPITIVPLLPVSQVWPGLYVHSYIFFMWLQRENGYYRVSRMSFPLHRMCSLILGWL